MTTEEAIDRFYSYFKNQLDQISVLQNRLYKKLLFVAMLDTLARAKHPDTPSNKQRFMKLIDDCSDWTNRTRIGLPLLSLNLSPIVVSELRDQVRERLAEWDYGKIYDLSVDPQEPELAQGARTEPEKKAIQNSRHADLLYIYRNHLVHEFREPGSGMEMNQRRIEPYYHGMTHLDNMGRSVTESWELVYPLGFFKLLAESCLANLKDQFEQNEINPYSSYEFGTLWKAHL